MEILKGSDRLLKKVVAFDFYRLRESQVLLRSLQKYKADLLISSWESFSVSSGAIVGKSYVHILKKNKIFLLKILV